MVHPSRPHTCSCYTPTPEHPQPPRSSDEYTPPQPGGPQEPLRGLSPSCDDSSTIYDSRACNHHHLYQPQCDHHHPAYSYEKCCTHDSKCPDYDARCDYHGPDYDPRECPHNSAYNENCDSFKKPVRKEECPDHPNAWIPPLEPTNTLPQETPSQVQPLTVSQQPQICLRPRQLQAYQLLLSRPPSPHFS